LGVFEKEFSGPFATGDAEFLLEVAHLRSAYYLPPKMADRHKKAWAAFGGATGSAGQSKPELKAAEHSRTPKPCGVSRG
jgi:hypothetical protein